MRGNVFTLHNCTNLQIYLHIWRVHASSFILLFIWYFVHFHSSLFPPSSNRTACVRVWMCDLFWCFVMSECFGTDQHIPYVIKFRCSVLNNSMKYIDLHKVKECVIKEFHHREKSWWEWIFLWLYYMRGLDGFGCLGGGVGGTSNGLRKPVSLIA